MSELRTTTISDLAGTGPVTLTKQSAAKAWLQYLQSTNVVSNSFGVSSVSDNSVGNYTVNYSSAFDSDAHSRAGTATHGAGTGVLVRSTTNTQFITKAFSTSTETDSGVYLVFHGDLA